MTDKETQSDESIIDEDNVIERIAELDECTDRDTFRQLIHTLRQNGPGCSVYVSLAREKYLEWCCLTEEDQEQWFTEINEFQDEQERYSELKSFYERLEVDNKSSEFYYKYVTFATDCYIQNKVRNDKEPLFRPYDIEVLLSTALKNTRYDFINGKKIWSVVLDIELRRNDQKLTKVVDLYLERLGIPHQQLDQTFSEYSSFVTQYYSKTYEAHMKQANKIYQETKKLQQKIESAWNLSDRDSSDEWIFLMNHIQNSTTKKKRTIDQIVPVFESAVLHTNDANLWIVFINFLYEYNERDSIINSVLVRFTRTFSNSLRPFTERLRNLTTAENPMLEFDMLQHRLNILLPTYDMNYEEWKEFVISLLSFQYKSVILGDLTFKKSILTTAQDYFDQSLEYENGDTFHSVARFVPNLFEKLDRLENARSCYKTLTSKFETEAEGWLISYNFERRQRNDSGALKILNAAINRAEKLDWPERIFEEALRFIEFIGDVGQIRDLQVKVQKKAADVFKVRLEQMENVEERGELMEGENIEGTITSNKRQLEGDDRELLISEETKKRRRETSRNREHHTVAVHHLSPQTTERQIIQFFKDCGEITEIKLTSLPGTISQQQANLVFDNEQSVSRALTKDFKSLCGSQLRIVRLFQNTVWVTNFPPSYTKETIGQLFSICGTITSVRFPSLKFNSQRRFCYIEFTTQTEAEFAVNHFDHKEIDGYVLTVKISDPSNKKSRSGSTEEGREVYVHKLDFFKVDANKLKTLFDKYGNIENINVPLTEQSRIKKRKNDGYAFVVFSTAEEANQAVLALNSVNLEGRVIEVSISEKKSKRIQKKETEAIKEYSRNSSNNSILLKNIPDTINSSQLKEFILKEIDEPAESTSAIQNVILEPEFSSAIIEFSDSRIAGLCSLKMERKILDGKTLSVGEVKELKPAVFNHSNQKANNATVMVPNRLQRRKLMREAQTMGTSGITSKEAATVTEQQTIPTSTEFKKEITTTDETSSNPDPSTTNPLKDKPKPKSNADFRAMFLSGRK